MAGSLSVCRIRSCGFTTSASSIKAYLSPYHILDRWTRSSTELEMRANPVKSDSCSDPNASGIASNWKTRVDAQRQSPLSTNRHLLTLRQYGVERMVSKAAAQFAEALARGFPDLLVVLLEPLDYFQATTLEEGIAASHTLQEVDRLIRLCSNNKRNLRNTAVFDIRVFLSARVRQTRPAHEFAVMEERSFAVFEQMVNELNPAVVLTCQCGTANAKSPFIRQMSSTFPPQPDRAYLRIGGRLVPFVKAFHPGVYKAEHIQHWAGPDKGKQDKCRRILVALLKEAFWKAFHLNADVDTVTARQILLLDQFRRLRCDRASFSASTRR